RSTARRVPLRFDVTIGACYYRFLLRAVPIDGTGTVTRTLLLMRHAEATQTAPGGRDRDRPLTAAGVADALAVGHRLNASGLLPDLALASDARRTRETLEGLSPALRVQPEIRLDPALYRADGRELLDRIREEGGTADCLLVIGHNPA